MKRVISILLCIALAFSCLSLSVGAANVVLSSQNLTVNGRPVECEKYNIDGSNYFKLRDIAYLLNGTTNQFEVGYDSETRTVTVTSGIPYTPNGEELIVGMDKSETAQPSTQSIIINGVVNSSISAYNLAGNNFFKLRDLGDVLGFIVDYDKASNTAIILSSNSSPSPNPAPEPSPQPAVTSELNAEQIYEKCSPAVFYIEVANSSGEVYATGSGFFISGDGTAITNYHVINGAHSARITLSATKQQYNVAGVYDYDEFEDWAIIKIDGSGFPCLEMADGATVIGGAKCYAIGSPKGLQNTISDGIISNPAQDLGGVSFIQISAAISHGSSGGALINKYGQVIGITSAGYEDGENLGFAIPISVIDGYSHYQVTALSELLPPSNTYAGVSAEDANDFLVAFVKANYTETQSDTLICSYTENTSTGTITRKLIYDLLIEKVRITIVEQYYDQEYWTSITLNSDSFFHTFTYSFYDNLYSQTPAFRAYNYTYAPGFLGDNLVFSGIDTNTGYDVELNESLASIYLQDALFFVDSIFYNNLTDYGVYLFGFTDYYTNTGGNDASSPEYAYECLIDFIKHNYNDKNDQSLIYSERGDTSTGYIDYILYYDTSSEDHVSIQKVELVNNELYILTTDLKLDSLYYIVTYSYYNNQYSETPAFRAFSRIYAPDFLGDNLVFTGVTTNAGYDVELNESFASADLQNILYFTDAVFDSYLSDYGVFGVDLFGFANYLTNTVDFSSNPTIVPSYYFPFHLYSNDGKVYLGKLVTNEFDSDSIWNEYGDYGSEYKQNSIWNEFGTYGSEFSQESAFNDFASNPPQIVDNNGNFFGYLTTNTTIVNGYTIIQIYQFLVENGQ